jgi:hypothetical protein
MKATMEILNLAVFNSNITPYGGPGVSPAGHAFKLEFNVRVTKRSMGGLSGEGVDCPALEWNERIEWFDHKPATGWYYVGENTGNMYARNPASNTFFNWHSARYLNAKYPPNGGTPGLATINDDKAAKHWIAANGLTWTIYIKDVPGMGLAGGSGGGGGASLVTGPSRRRVIYFDLGFSGNPGRARCVQILETLNGALTIRKFINQQYPKAQVDSPGNLVRWRAQLNLANDYNP